MFSGGPTLVSILGMPIMIVAKKPLEREWTWEGGKSPNREGLEEKEFDRQQEGKQKKEKRGTVGGGSRGGKRRRGRGES